MYLYPLYVRPLTGLGRHTDPRAADREWDEQRLRRYREGRDHLLSHGYEQVSMRMFRRSDAPPQGPDDYACQTDGMIGLGCGARSYTSRLHYSFDYAVSMREIRGIIDDYTATEDFSRALHGRWVDEDEARRRHLLQSLLQAEGLPVAEYRLRFGFGPVRRLPRRAGHPRRPWLARRRPGGPAAAVRRGAGPLGRHRPRVLLTGRARRHGRLRDEVRDTRWI